MADLALEWRPTAVADLLAIVDYIADDHPQAAQALKDELAVKVARLAVFPRACRIGRVTGTREMVVRPNYLVIYAEDGRVVTVLRILHAAQQWP